MRFVPASPCPLPCAAPACGSCSAKQKSRSRKPGAAFLIYRCCKMTVVRADGAPSAPPVRCQRRPRHQSTKRASALAPHRPSLPFGPSRQPVRFHPGTTRQDARRIAQCVWRGCGGAASSDRRFPHSGRRMMARVPGASQSASAKIRPSAGQAGHRQRRR